MAANHDGHRQRLKKSCLDNGLDTFNDINSLELLLFYAIPRVDTNELAHELLSRFGTLDGVFKASKEELCEVEGIGENAALLIMLIPALNRKRLASRMRENAFILDFEDAAHYFLGKLLYKQDELMVMICLDSRCRVIKYVELSHGMPDSVDVSNKKIIHNAIKCGSSQVVLAHNHPNGLLMPSREDEAFTSGVGEALGKVGISLADHLIITDEGAVSCMQRKCVLFEHD